MPPSTEQRSQPLLRLPKNQTPAMVTLHDGDRAQVFLFVSPGDSVAQVLAGGASFVPMGFASGTKLVARDAIAALSVHVLHAPIEDELPGERQAVVVRLRSGAIVRGELRWVPIEGARRTLDFLNRDASHLVIHDVEHVIYVALAHVATVEEV